MALVKKIIIITAGLTLLAACSTAQNTAPKNTSGAAFGKPIAEKDLQAWNIDIRTQDGQGLPAGQGNAVVGEKVYNAKCASCHGPDAKGGPVFGPMVGGIGSFKTNARVLTPGSMYPYAPILFDYVRRAMPMDKPQTLTNDEVYALSAYILNLNGLVGKTDEMNSKTLAAVKMPNRDGFMVDDRPDTNAVRCMTNCKP
ncbi:cytochrome c [Polynucleobacter sp. IMCC30063]|uniref:c-type cytochrome n=1 Tax=Polynucleobacter sp. IMCC30063 TaxID=2907298 RepID=UPI001F42E8B5|nr:cytochrome c [Polynucleobacter sp. IMCC30063]MCE7505591.1 cytochrome c [Polynucleobacter sp. IMCC30063]